MTDETFRRLERFVEGENPRTIYKLPLSGRYDPLRADVLRLIALARQAEVSAKPTAMILFCPSCGLQHLDEPDERTPDWTNPPHRSHLCHGCGHVWRPADIATEGVAWLDGYGKADSPPIRERAGFALARASVPEGWEPIESAPRDGTRVLVWFLGAGAIVAYREEEHPDQWVRYLGFGKSSYWPTIHGDLATGWLALPAPPSDAKVLK